jgi:hypothetical protein
MKPVFSLIVRELLGASRRPETWRIRVAVSASAIVGAATVLLVSRAALSGPTGLGSQLFLQLTAAAGLSALGLGVATTADAVSRERREGTLGLLFLTDLTGWDVVLGKAGAAVTGSAYALVSVLPILAIGMLLGGVTLGQVGVLSVALMNTLFVSMAVSIWVSTWCTVPRQAAGLATLGVFSVAVIPMGAMWAGAVDNGGSTLPLWTIGLGLPSPLMTLGIAAIPNSASGAALAGLSGVVPLPMLTCFALSLIVQQGIAWMLLAWAARRTRTVWQDAPSKPWTLRIRALWSVWTHGSPVARQQLRQRLLNRSAYLWLSQREVWKPAHPWILLAALASLVVWLVVILRSPWTLEEVVTPLVVVAQGLLVVWMVTESAARLVEERLTGSFELLLCTPLDRDAILSGQLSGLRRMFLAPAVVLILIDLWLILGVRGPGWAFPPDLPGPFQRFLLGALVALPATRWLATRLALEGRSIHALGVRTIMTVWLAPAALAHFFGMICEFIRVLYAAKGLLPIEYWGGLVLFCGVSWLIGYRAKQRVLLEFRALATQTRGASDGVSQRSGIRNSQTTGR